MRALRERLPDPHDDAAVDLPVRSDPVDDRARVVRGGDLEDAHDARLAVDLDANRVREDLRLEERLHPEAAEASLARLGRRVLRHGS